MPEVVLVCPKCGGDAPSEDLSNFVRYYGGDEGYETCPHCEFPILWKMSVTPNVPLLAHRDLLLEMGKNEAALDQLYAWGADPTPNER